MTRKDYVAIAKTIAALPLSDYDKWIVADSFAWRLLDTNPRFDRERFMSAALTVQCTCHVSGEHTIAWKA